MSTRWYPIYQMGNPQLRVFLPNFWLKLVKPKEKQPDNVVIFKCSMEMTKYDVKNYLEKIYNIPVESVRTEINMGRFKREPIQKYVIKEDDMKYAYVSLPKSEKFVFPDIFPETEEIKIEKSNRTVEEMKDGFRKYVEKNKNRRGTPAWFSY